MVKGVTIGVLAIAVVLLLGVSVAILFGTGIIQNFPGISDDFVKPQFARLECAPTDAFEGKNIKWLDQRTLFRCDANTEECRFTVDLTGRAGPVVGLTYKVCDFGSCSSSINVPIGAFKSPGRLAQFTINSGKEVQFNPTFIASKIKITQEWKPWQLYRFVGGAKFIVNSGSCQITSGARQKILAEDNVDKLFRTGGEGQKWINYVNDWVFGPANNVYDYKGQQAYCTAGAVYEIVKLNVADGTLKKVNPEYSGTTAGGRRIDGLGNRIANVECCPNEPTCTKNFEYVKVDDPKIIEKECFTDLQCFNAGGFVPETQTTYVTYSCIEDKCVKSAPITVECTTSSACGNGQICDLSTTNYGKCISQTIGEYCGDGICQITESANSCQADCGIGTGDKECSSILESYREQGEGLFGILPGKQAGCYTAGWVYLVVFLGFSTAIVVILIIIASFKIRRIRRF